jgi:predicted DCC family thiol-disulfide oxidoreductase YuxK
MELSLLFDSGCAVCTKLARAIERETEGWLAARSLHEPEVRALLDQARPGWRWEPTLLEVDGDRVRVSTGLVMRARLVLGLGPRRAWRVARLAHQAGMPLAGVDLSRRGFLQRGGALLAGLALLGPGLSLPKQGPQGKGPKNNGRHPLRDVEVQESVRLNGEESEAFRLRALESADIAHIKSIQSFDADEAVVYRHDLVDGNRFWAVAFAASNNGFVL